MYEVSNTEQETAWKRSYRYMCLLFRKQDERGGSCLLSLNARYAHVSALLYPVHWRMIQGHRYPLKGIITHETFLVFPFLRSIIEESEFFLRKTGCTWSPDQVLLDHGNNVDSNVENILSVLTIFSEDAMHNAVQGPMQTNIPPLLCRRLGHPPQTVHYLLCQPLRLYVLQPGTPEWTSFTTGTEVEHLKPELAMMKELLAKGRQLGDTYPTATISNSAW